MNLSSHEVLVNQFLLQSSVKVPKSNGKLCKTCFDLILLFTDRGDRKCNHDYTHRVCAQLLKDGTCEPKMWGSENFWQITGKFYYSS